MTEASLKGRLVSLIQSELLGAMVLRHEDLFRSGTPDMSVTWHARTSWWEVKFCNPRLLSKGIQEQTMLKLEGAGQAFYLLYELHNGIKRTRIVLPRHLHHAESLLCVPGFDHRAVIEFIKAAHHAR